MRDGIRQLDVLLLGAAMLIAFLLLGPVLLIPLHIPLSYNEGWNAYFAARAVGLADGPLYPPADTLVFNNYPPLSFYLIGLLGRWIGDVIVAGRIVALASLLTATALLGACVSLLGGTWRGSMSACMLLLLYMETFFRGYVAVDEPQWLGHALMLDGLVVLLRCHCEGRAASPYEVASVVVAALLMTAGGFVKHSLVGLPIAVTIWLALVRPRLAGLWLAAALGAVAVGLVLTGMLHGRAAFADILAHHRVFQANRAFLAVKRMLPLLPLILVAGLAYRRRATDDRAMLFAGLFVVVSALAGIAQRVGEGVNYNAYFEVTIALCLTAGLAVSRSLAPPASPGALAIRPALLVGFAGLPLLVTMPGQLQRAWYEIADRGRRAQSWQPLIASVAASPAIVGCQYLSICYWAGRPFAVDTFNLDQSILTGGSIARFDRMARAHDFSLFEFDGGRFRGTTPKAAAAGDPLLQDLLAHGYAAVGTDPDGNVLLAPESFSRLVPASPSGPAAGGRNHARVPPNPASPAI